MPWPHSWSKTAAISPVFRHPPPGEVARVLHAFPADWVQTDAADLAGQDLAGAAPGSVVRSFLLEPRGKVQSMLWVLRGEDRVEIENVLGIPAEDILRISAKTGDGVPELLDAIAEHIPPPVGDPDLPLQALIFFFLTLILYSLMGLRRVSISVLQ